MLDLLLLLTIVACANSERQILYGVPWILVTVLKVQLLFSDKRRRKRHFERFCGLLRRESFRNGGKIRGLSYAGDIF